MADNVVANPGEGGATFATDDIGGVQYPRHKIIIGADGVNDGDVSAANPMPVTGTVGVSGSVAVTGALTDAQLRASAVPISAPSLPLPTGAATETTAAAINAKLPTLATTVPGNDTPGLPIRQIGQYIFNASFSDVGASVLSPQFIAPIVGTGVGYSQASGALAITAGTTVRAEFLTRTSTTFSGSMRLRISTVLSQRNANNNFLALLADLIGEGLTVTINSATSITVDIPGHAYTSQNVGQFMYIGGIVGAAGVPGRYAIASVVAGVSVTFTVAGWPASGSCTATLFGHSFAKVHYTGATATNALVTTQRKGWADADTTATINTTASPGHIVHMELTGRECFWYDTLRASGTAPTVVQRAFRYESLPDDNEQLYLFLWSFNGTSAPTATTWTISFCAVEDFANTPVYIQGARANGAANPQAVAVQGTVPVSGTVTVTSTRITPNVADGHSSTFHLISAASTNGTIVRGTAGAIGQIVVSNNAATASYFKLYNSATVTVGTTTPVLTALVPPGGTVVLGGNSPIRCATGVCIGLTKGIAVADTAAVGASEMAVSIFYT